MTYVSKVNVYPTSVTIKKGQFYYDAYAVVSPSNATCGCVEWSSDDISVATVNFQTGYIYGKSGGTARIYATATDGSGKSDYITVTVDDTVNVSAIYTCPESISLKIGETTTLSPIIYPNNATNKALNWTTTNTNAVSVSGAGVVTAKAAGVGYITAHATDGSGKTGSSFFEVIGNVAVQSVEVEPTSKTMTVGDSAYLYATVCPTNATNKQIVWKSNKTSVATVNSTSGLVYAQGAGTATITAEAQDGSGKKDTCTITVNSIVPVTGVTVCPEAKTLNIGESTTLQATVYPYNATNKSVTWRSSNESVACVDRLTGYMTALKAGTTYIMAITNDGNLLSSCIVTVKDPVIIEKDGVYSKVIFSDGKIWKCNVYYYDTTLESNLPVDNNRANHNATIDFSTKQLGFLFKIDPNGVIYYVMNKQIEGETTSTDYLIYRDDIFKEIYGRLPRYFTYENSQLYFCTGINYDNRYSVYSEAELIFGMLPRWTLQNVVETLFGAALAIISIYVPALSTALLTYDLVTAFFFTGAIDGGVNAAASEFISESISSNYGDKLSNRFGWAMTIVGLIPSLLESSLPPDIDEEQISIYENAYQNEDYVIKVSDSNQTVDLNEFIEHYKSLILS